MAKEAAKITYSDGTSVTVPAGGQAPNNGKTVTGISAVTPAGPPIPSGGGNSGNTGWTTTKPTTNTNNTNNNTTPKTTAPVTTTPTTTTTVNGVSPTDANQIEYLNTLISQGGGNAEWAKQELAKMNQDTVKTYMDANQKAYLNNLVAQGGANAEWAKQELAKASGTIVTTNDGKKDALERLLQKQEEGFIQQQTAQLASARDSKIAELQKTLENEISEGNISVREAEDAYSKAVTTINQQYYIDSQMTNVTAESRGIQNSQQMLGLQKGDMARKNNSINNSASERDLRIANIRDRLTAIKNKINIDIANSNSEYNYAVAGAVGSAKQATATNQYNLELADYESDKQKEDAIDLAILQSQLKIQEMVKAGEISAEQATIAFQRELEAMAIQNGYSMAQIYARVSASNSSDGYMVALQRKAAQYGIKYQGMSEDELAKAVNQYEKKQAKTDAIESATLEADVVAAQKLLAEPVPTPPKDSIFNFDYDEEYNEYRRKLDAIARAKALLNR